jgi:hypothetical protein
MAAEELRRLDALLTTGLGLARKAPSGRLLLARIADSIEVDWIPRPWGEEIASELEAARAAGASRSTLARSRGSFATPGERALRMSSTTWTLTRLP